MRTSYAILAAGGLLAAVASNLSDFQGSNASSSTTGEPDHGDSDDTASASDPELPPSVTDSGSLYTPDEQQSLPPTHFDNLTISSSTWPHQKNVDPE